MNTVSVRKSPKPTNRHQQGMSAIAVLAFIAIGLLLLTCTLKMLPVYAQHWSVQSLFDGLLEEYIQDNNAITKSEIRSKLAKRLNINQIDVMSIKNVEIDKNAVAYTVIANYEVREPLFANIDVVMIFENSIELPLIKN